MYCVEFGWTLLKPGDTILRRLVNQVRYLKFVLEVRLSSSGGWRRAKKLFGQPSYHLYALRRDEIAGDFNTTVQVLHLIGTAGMLTPHLRVVEQQINQMQYKTQKFIQFVKFEGRSINQNLVLLSHTRLIVNIPQSPTIELVRCNIRFPNTPDHENISKSCWDRPNKEKVTNSAASNLPFKTPVRNPFDDRDSELRN